MLALLIGWFLDALCGEVKRWHPLVGLGNCAQWLEARWGASSTGGAGTPLRLRMQGLVCAGILVVLSILVATGLRYVLYALAPAWFAPCIDAVFLYLCLGHRSLQEHARAVAKPLLRRDLATAQQALSMIVSRDTHSLDESAVAKGVVESVLENGSDAVVASLFWFALAGVPGVIAHRCINTLDAMWGYKSPRYLYFGWAAARLDDLVNWIPARLCAVAYLLAGDARQGALAWRQQAHLHKSPNAGAVMAAGAGALGVIVGGPAQYRGQWEERPELGLGVTAGPEDIERALRLLSRALLLLGAGYLGLRWLL